MAASVLALGVPGGTLAAAGHPATVPDCDTAERYTPEEVQEATAEQTVVPVLPVYAVPKCDLDITLAFLHVDLSIPAFVEWNRGAEAAADFYGVEYLTTDMRNQPAETLTQYETLTARQPDVVGTSVNPSDSALYARTQEDGVALLLSGPSFSDPPSEAPSIYTGDNIDLIVGTEVGRLIGEAAAERLEGPWAGRTVTFIGVGEPSVPIVVTRMESALAAAREFIEIDDANVVMLATMGSPETAQNQVTDVLTANPDNVFVIAPLNDETGVGALQAVRNAGRAEDAVLALFDGGPFGRTNMRNDTDGIIAGSVHRSVFSDGWTWVEAAIATARDEEFVQRTTNFVILTKDNLDELFPDDE